MVDRPETLGRRELYTSLYFTLEKTVEFSKGEEGRNGDDLQGRGGEAWGTVWLGVASGAVERGTASWPQNVRVVEDLRSGEFSEILLWITNPSLWICLRDFSEDFNYFFYQ